MARFPGRQDACELCYSSSLKKRRLSTLYPSVRMCHHGCEKYVWEIHLSCMDCAEKFNICPWCDATPYQKREKLEKAGSKDFSDDDLEFDT
jgi:hypothetical protein